MKRLRARSRALVFVVVGLVACATGIVLDSTDALKRLELDTVDARFSLRGDQEPPDDIAVVEIDDITFSDLDQQWPFPRSMHGDVIDALSDDGADVIAYDVQFTEPSVPKEDRALENAVDRADNVVLATTELNRADGTNVFGGDRVVERLGATAAMSNLPLDPNAVVRRMIFNVRTRKTFSVVAEELASGEEITRDDFGGHTTWVDYVGGSGAIETYSFSEVLQRRFEPGTFEGKTVVVGASSPTLQDVWATSTTGQTVMSGPEVHANMIATARAGFSLTSVGAPFGSIMIILAGLAAPLASLRLRVPGTFLTGLAAGAVIVFGSYVAFRAGWVVEIVYPLIALIIGIVGALAVHYVTEAVDRQRTRDLFARFVPADVVDAVMDRADEDLRLGGVRLQGTVMFCDLRGFTTFAEALDPDEVIKVLNQYLASMSDAVMDHGGTLITYMGDGIMAVFGAPLEQDDHADRALATAREMAGQRLADFNAWLRGEGLSDGFTMGIGLNSGPVMSGNVGSERRVEYTAIGDTTNTASRVEKMTKGSPFQVLISGTTYEALEEKPEDLAFFEDAEVRGREARVALWGWDQGTSGD